MLQINHLSLKYQNTTILDDISLTLPHTGFIGIKGESGCGKTTFLYAISSLLEHEGQVYFNHQEINQDFVYSSLSFIKQNKELINSLTVKENIELVTNSSSNKINDIMRLLEIEQLSSSYPLELSVGQQKRVAIARALVKNSSIILADEPTGALHQRQSREVMGLLKNASENRLVIIVSHDQELLDEYCDDVLSMKNGKLINNLTENIDDSSVDIAYLKQKLPKVYVIKQLLYQKSKLAVLMIFQTIVIVSFLLILSIANGVYKSVNDSYEYSPIKNRIYLQTYDYTHLDPLKDYPFHYVYQYDLGVLKNNDQELYASIYELDDETSTISLKSGTIPKNAQEVIVSSSLYNDLIDKSTCLYTLNNQTISLRITGVLEDDFFHQKQLFVSSSFIKDELFYLDNEGYIEVKDNYKDVMERLNKEYYCYNDMLSLKEGYQSLIDIGILVAFIFLFVSFFVSTILIQTVISTIYFERKHDYALLRSFGIKNKIIKRAQRKEGLLMGMMLSVCGIVFYTIVSIVINDGYHLYTHFYFNLELPSIVFPYDLYFFMTIVYCMLTYMCSVVPSRQLLKLDIVATLREE